MEHTTFSSSSPHSNIFFRCLVIAYRCVPNNSAICACVSQTVSSFILTSICSASSLGRYRIISFFTKKVYHVLKTSSILITPGDRYRSRSRKCSCCRIRLVYTSGRSRKRQQLPQSHGVSNCLNRQLRLSN